MILCHFIYWFFTYNNLSAVIIVVTSFYYILTSFHNEWRKLNVPHARFLPLFGNTFKMFMKLEHQMDTFDRLYRKFPDKKFFGFYQMMTPHLMIRDPALINKIMVKDFSYFTDHGIHTDLATNVLKNSLFFLTGHRWKIMRQKLNPGFSSSRLRGAYDQINESCGQLLDCIDEKLQKDVEKCIEIKHIIGKLSSDVIGTWAFGLKLDTLKNENSEFPKHKKNILQSTIKQRFIQVLLTNCPKLTKTFKLHLCLSEASAFFYSIFSSVINFRHEKNEVKNDFTQTLINANKELVLNPTDDLANGDEFTEADIIGNAILMFVSGSGTVTSTLSLCFYELALNKHIQDKLRKEIILTKAKQSGQFNQDYVMNLQYIMMVLNEIARKYSIGCTILREATKNYNVPNESLVIKKGQKIIIPMYSIHNDPQYYPNPDIFDPERFSMAQKSKRLNGTFFPYGDGPRICIGKRFSELEMILVLSNVLSKYEILPCKKTEIPLNVKSESGFISPKNGIWLKFKPLASAPTFTQLEKEYNTNCQHST